MDFLHSTQTKVDPSHCCPTIIDKTPLTEEETQALIALVSLQLNRSSEASPSVQQVKTIVPQPQKTVVRKNHRRRYWDPRSWVGRSRS